MILWHNPIKNTLQCAIYFCYFLSLPRCKNNLLSSKMIIFHSSMQCLVNVLKSLIEWEKSQQEARKQASSQLLEEVSQRDSVEMNRDNEPGNTMEAAISEVIN